MNQKSFFCLFRNVVGWSLLATVLAIHQAAAVTKTWNDDFTDTTDWGTPDNWDAPGVPASGDDALFTSIGNVKDIYLGTEARTIKSITFDSSTGSTPYRINLRESSSVSIARLLSVASSGIRVNAGSHTIKGNGSTTATELSLANGIALNVATNSTLNVEARLGVSSSSGSYAKTGLGTLVFKATNNGSGGLHFSNGLFTVSAGTLELAAANSSGNGSNKYLIASGAIIKFSTSGIWSSSAGTLTLNGTGVPDVGALHASATSSFSANTIKLDTNSAIGVDASRTLTISIAISGTGTPGLNKVGNGNLVLNNTANTYTGATTVTSGTLTLVGGSHASPMTVSSGASLSFTLGSPTTSSSTFDLSTGTIKITGTPSLNSHTLITSSTGIIGRPVLHQAVPGYALKVVGNSLMLEVAAGYTSWASLNGAGVNLNDDHDHDGVPNGVEYFLGGTNGNTTGLTTLPCVTNTGGALSITWAMGSGYAGTYGTDFTVETSDTLTGTWTTVTLGVNVVISGSNVTYTFPSPMSPKKFVRLKVTGP